ncbi:hypothetical protein D3C75_762040 [compost metagenome]
MPTPGVTTEFRAPVVRQNIRRTVAPDIKLAEWAFFVQRFVEPGVLGGCMVENHIQNDTDAALVGAGD